MRKILFLVAFLVSCTHLSAQNLDLIVSNGNDSIACRIDSVGADLIYFTTRINNNSTSTSFSITGIRDYKYDCVDPQRIKRIPNTIYFETKKQNYNFNKSHLKTLETTELADYFVRAKRIRKTGGIMLLGGSALFLLGGAAAIDTGNESSAFVILAGVLTSAVGIPVTISGASKTKRIKSEYSYRNIAITANISPTTARIVHSDRIVSGISLVVSF